MLYRQPLLFFRGDLTIAMKSHPHGLHFGTEMLACLDFCVGHNSTLLYRYLVRSLLKKGNIFVFLDHPQLSLRGIMTNILKTPLPTLHLGHKS